MTRAWGLALAGVLLAGAATLFALRARRGVTSGYVVPPPSPTAAPLVVTLVVDQLAAWLAEERLPLLPEDGGFARLRREGTWVTRMDLAHAATETGPGHAALYSGVSPRRSGITNNDLCSQTGGKVAVLRDPAVQLILPSDERGGPGASLASMRVPVLADRLRAARPDAVIVAISLKDRGAVFGGGRAPDAAIWWDKGLDTFVTSSAFASSFPAWAREAGAAPALAALRREPWTLLDEAWVRAHAATPDDQEGEGDIGGFGITFPHDYARAARPPDAFRASPAADTAVLTLALAALDAYRKEAPMLLAISLSANDYVGHAFGPDSWEAWDHLLRLDAALAAFFRALDARAGAAGWSVVLAADHGVVHMPEPRVARPWCAPGAKPDPYGRPCEVRPRLDPHALGDEMRAAAQEALGPGEWVGCVTEPYVRLTPAALALPADRRRALLDALEARLRAHEQVADVLRTDEVPANCPGEGDKSLPALLCRSIDPTAPAALYVLVRPDASIGTDVVLGKGSSHGTPYTYDRTVPLLVRSPGRIAAGRVVHDPVSYRAFSETAASLLGLHD